MAFCMQSSRYYDNIGRANSYMLITMYTAACCDYALLRKVGQDKHITQLFCFLEVWDNITTDTATEFAAEQNIWDSGFQQKSKFRPGNCRKNRYFP